VTRRALITGITGQDGSYLAESLAASGVEVCGLVRPGDPTVAGLPPVVDPARLFTADLTDVAAVRRALTECAPHEVYHLAGMSSVAASWEDPVGTGHVNGVAAVALMTAAVEANPDCHVVFASSAEIFAGVRAPSYAEDAAIAPVTPYGTSKAYAHLTARVLREHGARISSAILFNHESPRRPDTFVTRRITVSAARIAAGLESHLELGNLDARRDWGWAPDYVEAMRLMAAQERPDDYVLATGTAHSVREFALAALTAAGVADPQERLRVNPEFLRTADAPVLVGNPGKAQRELGWRRTVDFEGLVSAMVEADVARLRAGL